MHPADEKPAHEDAHTILPPRLSSFTPLAFLSCSYSTRVRPRHHDDRVYPLIRVALRAPGKAQAVSEFLPLVSLRVGEMRVPADRQLPNNRISRIS